jgi:hypothetical protein
MKTSDVKDTNTPFIHFYVSAPPSESSDEYAYLYLFSSVSCVKFYRGERQVICICANPPVRCYSQRLIFIVSSCVLIYTKLSSKEERDIIFFVQLYFHIWSSEQLVTRTRSHESICSQQAASYENFE